MPARWRRDRQAGPLSHERLHDSDVAGGRSCYNIDPIGFRQALCRTNRLDAERR